MAALYGTRWTMLRKGFRPEDALLICGEPRGGTTWLMELLATRPGAAVVWEPLHPQRGVLPRALRLGWRPFIPDTVHDEQALHELRSILSGRKVDPWTMYVTPAARYRAADHLLVKCCYASALLPWLTAHIAFGHKPIHLLRHPVATALSQVRLFKMSGPLHTIEEPDDRYDTLMRSATPYLRSLTTHLQFMTAHWCMANQRTLAHPARHRHWCTVFYEDLLLHPERELARITQETGITLPAEALQQVRKGSLTVRGNDLEADPAAQLAKWMHLVPADERAQLQAVLDHFGVTVYHTASALPVRPA